MEIAEFRSILATDVLLFHIGCLHFEPVAGHCGPMAGALHLKRSEPREEEDDASYEPTPPAWSPVRVTIALVLTAVLAALASFLTSR